jgi:2'-5' RNA ligase
MSDRQERYFIGIDVNETKIGARVHETRRRIRQRLPQLAVKKAIIPHITLLPPHLCQPEIVEEIFTQTPKLENARATMIGLRAVGWFQNDTHGRQTLKANIRHYGDYSLDHIREELIQTTPADEDWKHEARAWAQSNELHTTIFQPYNKGYMSRARYSRTLDSAHQIAEATITDIDTPTAIVNQISLYRAMDNIDQGYKYQIHRVLDLGAMD